jgi:Sulfate permease and related transporters (MFS superfamily)
LGFPHIPKVNFDTIKALIQPAFAIAILGSIESLLSAVVSDSMIGGKHRTNMELVAQGGANIMSSIFGGIPATGAIARTATNVKNGDEHLLPVSFTLWSYWLLCFYLHPMPN